MDQSPPPTGKRFDELVADPIRLIDCAGCDTAKLLPRMRTVDIFAFPEVDMLVLLLYAIQYIPAEKEVAIGMFKKRRFVKFVNCVVFKERLL